MTFEDVALHVFAAHGRGDYQSAIDALDGFQPETDDQSSDVTFWRTCLLSLLGRRDEAIAVFEKGLAQGFWWGESLLSDSDLDALRDLPDWQRLATESKNRSASSVPDSLDPLYEAPDDWHYGGPSLIALQGAGSRADLTMDRYRSVLAEGVRLIIPHATDPVSAGRFAWPAEDAETQLLAQLGEFDPIEPPVLLAGYSQGAGVAGYCAWSGAVDVQGVLLVAASLRVRGIPHRCAQVRHVPTYFVTGTEDPTHSDSVEAARSLESCGVPVMMDERPGLGHQYPDDFDETLRRAVAWLLER